MRSSSTLRTNAPRAFAAPFLPLLLGVVVLLTSGCRAHRTLEIRTDPPGAHVVVDHEVLGPSPVEIEFFHYGTRRITVSEAGYQTYSQRVEIVPPWYARFPLDILSEVLLPIGWRDHHVVDVPLEPGTDVLTTPDIRSVLDRAEALRRAGPSGPDSLPPVRVTSVGAAGSEGE